MRRPTAIALAVLLVGCQNGQLGVAAAPTLPSEVGVGPRSAFAVAAPAGLIGLDADGKMLGYIVPLPPLATPSAPTLDPSGKTIVFVLAQTTEEGGFGSDIYSVNIDGSDLRPLLKHDGPGVFFASPTFDRIGGFLYVHRRVAVGNMGNEDSIERIDLRAGERRTILKDAVEPTVSSDGKTLLYVHMYQGDQDGLWTAGADGAAPQPFLKTRDTFLYVQAPRVSPTGREVVLSSAGRFQNRAVPGTEVARPVGPGGRLAHLLIPSEIFLAPIDGTSLRSIATTGDDVVPAWSSDSTRVAYVALSTFYVLATADGAVKLTQRVAFQYGDPVWLR